MPAADHDESAEPTDESYPSLRNNWNFLRLLFGRLVTNAGDSLYVIAGIWLVYELTQSGFYTGVAGALLMLPPAFKFALGPLVDRWPLTRILVWTQLVQAVLVLSLPIAAYFDHLSVELLLVLIPLLSLLNQFVYPAQIAALPRIVPENQLTRANSAFMFANQGTNMVFRAVGGVLIAILGAVALFIVDAVTFVIAAISFTGIRIPTPTDTPDETATIGVSGYLSDLRDGIEWLRGTVFIELMFTAAVANFGTGVLVGVLPAFAALRGGSILYGALFAAMGGGVLLGALVASRFDHIKYGSIRIVGLGVGFVLWLGAVYSPWPPLTVVLFVLTGIPVGISNVMKQTLIQTVTPDDFLGRVTSVDDSVGAITLPIGSFLGGTMSSVLGVVTTMAVAAFSFGFVSLYFAIRPRLRHLPAMNDIDPTEFNISDPSATDD